MGVCLLELLGWDCGFLFMLCIFTFGFAASGGFWFCRWLTLVGLLWFLWFWFVDFDLLISVDAGYCGFDGVILSICWALWLGILDFVYDVVNFTGLDCWFGMI